MLIEKEIVQNYNSYTRNKGEGNPFERHNSSLVINPCDLCDHILDNFFVLSMEWLVV